MLTAPKLDKFPTSYFANLARKWAASQKQVALLIDEVQRNVNSEHWDDLLKVVTTNLLVVGTGIPYEISPQFQKKMKKNLILRRLFIQRRCRQEEVLIIILYFAIHFCYCFIYVIINYLWIYI
jgi:hypothetical protein